MAFSIVLHTFENNGNIGGRDGGIIDCLISRLQSVGSWLKSGFGSTLRSEQQSSFIAIDEGDVDSRSSNKISRLQSSLNRLSI